MVKPKYWHRPLAFQEKMKHPDDRLIWQVIWLNQANGEQMESGLMTRKEAYELAHNGTWSRGSKRSVKRAIV